MFANCSSLKEIKMPEKEISYIEKMSHMFENCFSITSLSLSFISLTKTENTENMFANDENLVYVNFNNAGYSNIKNAKNMFLRTLENMVFCIKEFSSPQLNRIIHQKGCPTIDCSENWSKNRKLISAETGNCVDKCSTPFIFFYEYKCYKSCPHGTVPVNLKCVENFDGIGDINNCTIKKYFRNLCEMNLTTPLSKRKFIEATVNSFKNGTLYELGVEAIEGKKKFIIKEETEIYSIYSVSNKDRENGTTYIDLDNCINILSRLYGFSYDDFIVFKIEYTSPDFKIPIIEYSLFAHYGIKKFQLHSCRNSKIKYYINRYISNFEDYKYNPENDYYYNVCNINEKTNNTVLTLYQRRNMFNVNNMSLCESNCIFKAYVGNIIYCDCDVKLKFNSFMNVNVSKYDLISRFDIKNSLNINIWVVQCFVIFFSKEFILTNLFSQINLCIIFFSIICILIFYLKEKYTLFNNIKKLIVLNQLKKDNNKKNTSNDNKSNKKAQRNKENIINFSNRSTTKRLNITLNKKNSKHVKFKEQKNINEKTHNELNNLSYTDAVLEDYRTFFQYYFSLVITKNILIFSFNCRHDFNSKVIKLCFFLYIFFIHLVTNTIFITEETFEALFISQGKMMFHYYPNIIGITIITLAIKNILLNFIFTESNTLSIKNYKLFRAYKIMSYMINIIEIKCCLFFVINITSLLLFWIYIACFFTMFKSVQFFVLINTLVSFGITLLFPICLGFIPGIIRFYSLSNRKKQNRLFSYYLSQIIQALI